MARHESVRHHDAQYGRLATRLYAEVRAAAFGEDIGQNGWLSADEHDLFIEWLVLDPASRVLDVACGSGATTLRVARRAGCRVRGIDIHPQAVEAATAAARELGMGERAAFRVADATGPLPFDDGAFDAVTCIDAINHFPDRAAVLREWARVLHPGGRLVFTDPIVVTGPLTSDEIALRASPGVFLFVPPGYDEHVLYDCGFDIVETADRTENIAVLARRWREARAARAAELREVEGEETFEGQQRFLEVAARLAAERRLSRMAYRAARR
jgi:SAM-dependent methyltransferase